MKKSTLIASSVLAAFGALAQAADKPAQLDEQPGSILIRFGAAPKSCDDDMPFRAGVAIVSEDPARPGMMAFSIGSVGCIADPVPSEEHAGDLAYMTAQLGPAYVLDQMQRNGSALPHFSFNYHGTLFEMQKTGERMDSEMMSMHTLYCQSYVFANSTPQGQFLASGNMQVCLPAHRLEKGNLPVVPLAEAMKGPSPAPERHYTEPRDKQYYGS